VLGMTSLALATELTDEQRHYLQDAYRSGEGLLTLLSDILDFSRIESGRLRLEVTGFSLREQIQDAYVLMAPQARQKKLRFEWQADPEVPDRLSGDPFRLRQIFVNLLGNAIKFTDRGSVRFEIELDSHSGADVCVRFRVIDTGIGISTEELPMIFEAFSQADGSITRHHGGSGLGLAITSHLVEMMRGKIWIESRAGAGSTVHFTARFSRPGNETETCRTAASPASRQVAETSGETGSRSILVAEDNAISQMVTVRLLEKWGHRVRLAPNGAEALKAAEAEEFDLILMDVQMPVMDGLEATRRIRTSEQTSGRHVPIVAMTAHGMKGDRERCLDAGMDGYVAKPIRVKELFDALREFVQVGS